MKAEVNDVSLRGKVALVTGAAAGIGRGVAIELARQGARVAINDVDRPDAANITLQMVREASADGMIIQADVAHPEQVQAMVEEVVRRYGHIDVLVNNAAIQPNLGLMDYDDAWFDRVMSVNLLGYLNCIQAVVPVMKGQRRGRIVCMSSVHAKRPTDFDTVYAMSKGGIKMLVRESAIELAQYGITVNMIEPGAVQVGRKSGNPRPIVPPDRVTEESRRRGARKFPLGRIGVPSDIGHIVCFLASDEAEFITGAAIRADGGSMLL
ncbi:short-chain dehydrogenase/reductase SDR [Alicyclobacillus hesperidum URH17-3-68]|uniref:Glucose 1-dehydrogenase n=1 Tax=Alicyclobacillus hesperidum TaxID=89784 RepID=A0A1H2WXJ3_9BACL|nr:glucose 1-dehydrogenase [Alicyclobacillus hesperidum]EJY54969.1 short-chain dehydrogenase/reductase SDR [Alicyclobacillus hesperidum URH17-3-68]SDW85295.1 glucose 1-dehydrogenase [Alicyclobacillus hesperidum]